MKPKGKSEWSEPTQDRSREKVSRILDAAVELATEEGSLDLKMTSVASRAKVAIGTLYQYFPSRSALISRLFKREMEPIDSGVAEVLQSARSFGDLVEAIEVHLRNNLELLESRPGLRVIWLAPSVDPVVQAADYENTRKNAKELTDRFLATLGPQYKEAADVKAAALLICHLWGSVMRLCATAEKSEVGPILRQYSSMLAWQGVMLSEAKQIEE